MTARDVPKEQKNRAFTLATDVKSVWFPQGGTRVAKVSDPVDNATISPSNIDVNSKNEAQTVISPHLERPIEWSNKPVFYT